MLKRTILAIALVLVIFSTVSAQDFAVITADNADDMEQVMRLGRGMTETIDFSFDGSILAVGGSVGVWLYETEDLATEVEPILLVTPDRVKSVEFIDDAKILVADESGLSLWDLASMEEKDLVRRSISYFATTGTIVAINGSAYNTIDIVTIDNFDVEVTIEAKSLYELAFSPDGSILAGVDTSNNIIFWDVEDGEELGRMTGHTSRIYELAFSPDGSLLATGSSDYTLRLWDMAEMSELATLQETDVRSTVFSVAFSPDGAFVAAGQSDDKIRIWDIAELEIVNTAEGHDNSVNAVAFSPDGSLLASSSNDLTVRLWNAEDVDELAVTVGHTSNMNSVAFNPDGSILGIGGSGRRSWLWDTSTMPELHLSSFLKDSLGATAENKTSVTFSPDGKIAATIDGFDIRLWNPENGDEIGKLDGEGLTTSISFSPDSSLAVYVGSDGVFVFDVAKEELLISFSDHTAWVKTVAFSPQQTMIATGSDDGTVRIWALPE